MCPPLLRCAPHCPPCHFWVCPPPILAVPPPAPPPFWACPPILPPMPPFVPPPIFTLCPALCPLLGALCPPLCPLSFSHCRRLHSAAIAASHLFLIIVVDFSRRHPSSLLPCHHYDCRISHNRRLCFSPSPFPTQQHLCVGLCSAFRVTTPALLVAI